MKTLSREAAKQRIHDAGLRATAPRIAVLRMLASAAKPLSHGEMVDAIGSDEWDQATVYRNLRKLVDSNLARVASEVGGVTRYEARGEDDGPHLHPHFSCRSCGTVECLPEARLTGPVSRRWLQSLKSSELQLIGECPDCIEDPKRPAAARGRRRGSHTR